MEENKMNEVAALIIVYSNTQKPGFELMYFDAQKKMIGLKKIALETNQISQGLPLQTIDLNALLRPAIPAQIKSIKILLDSDEIFKATNAYPKVSWFRMSGLYAQDLRLMHALKNFVPIRIQNSSQPQLNDAFQQLRLSFFVKFQYFRAHL